VRAPACRPALLSKALPAQQQGAWSLAVGESTAHVPSARSAPGMQAASRVSVYKGVRCIGPAVGTGLSGFCVIKCFSWDQAAFCIGLVCAVLCAFSASAHGLWLQSGSAVLRMCLLGGCATTHPICASGWFEPSQTHRGT